MKTLKSESYNFTDVIDFNNMYHEKGWTDGLPILPPTQDNVREHLQVAQLTPDHVIGTEPVRARPLTAEKIAINAVMAGCLPTYAPVVFAILEAMCEPQFNLHGCTASTGGSAPFIVINGPIRQALETNSTHNVLGNRSRANASIGRAVRLVLLNVLGCVPGELDRSTLGHPGKFTFCIAEDEENSPWVPLAQQRGVPAGRSSVTVMAGESPRQTMNEWTHAPEEIVETFAAEIRHNMLTYSIWAGNYALIIPTQLRDLIAGAGWGKDTIQEYIHRSAHVIRNDWARVGKQSVVDKGKGPTQTFSGLRVPDDLLVIAAGGPAGGFGAIVPPWLGSRSQAVTQQIRD